MEIIIDGKQIDISPDDKNIVDVADREKIALLAPYVIEQTEKKVAVRLV